MNSTATSVVNQEILSGMPDSVPQTGLSQCNERRNTCHFLPSPRSEWVCTVNWTEREAERDPYENEISMYRYTNPTGRTIGDVLNDKSRPPIYTSRSIKFSKIEDCLSATERNPSAEILNIIKPRVMELSEAALEEGSEGQLPLSDVSYLGLVNFLNQIVDPDLNLLPLKLIPGLVLTYEGNIIAEWQLSLDEILTLEFIDSSCLEFVFFCCDSYTPTRVARISGSGSVLGFLNDYPKALEFLRRISSV